VEQPEKPQWFGSRRRHAQILISRHQRRAQPLSERFPALQVSASLQLEEWQGWSSHQPNVLWRAN